jgi:hypothetical protein
MNEITIVAETAEIILAFMHMYANIAKKEAVSKLNSLLTTEKVSGVGYFSKS